MLKPHIFKFEIPFPLKDQFFFGNSNIKYDNKIFPMLETTGSLNQDSKFIKLRGKRNDILHIGNSSMWDKPTTCILLLLTLV